MAVSTDTHVSQVSPPVAPPPPPPSPPPQEVQRDQSVARINTALEGDVGEDDVHAIAAELRNASPEVASAVVQEMARTGALERFALESVEHQGRWDIFGGSDGFTFEHETAFFTDMAGKLDGQALGALSAAYGNAEGYMSGAHVQQVGEAVAARASPQTRADFVAAIASRTSDSLHGFGPEGYFNLHQTDADAINAARVLSTLQGSYAAQAYASMTAEQRRAVLAAAAGLDRFQNNPSTFNGLIAAASCISDPAARAAVLSDAAYAVVTLRSEHALGGDEAARMADRVAQAFDAQTLGALSPDRAAQLASVVTHDPTLATGLLNRLASAPQSAGRDALIRTIFLKISGETFEDNPDLAAAAGDALARTLTAEPAQAAAAQTIQAALGAEEGRSLLTDQNVDPAARLGAMDLLVNDPARMRAALEGAGDKAWEDHEVLQIYGQSRAEQYSAARGNAGTWLQSGTDFDNFVGASLSAPIRGDLPQGETELQQAQAQAAHGRYNFYQGVGPVQQAADGLRAAQRQLGGGPVQVSVLPVQFSSQASGPVDLQIYRVTAQDGQSRIVDNTGRVYADFNAWTTDNQLPPGKVTFVSGGVLNENGTTRLETRNTPNTSDTFWEHVTDIADVAALAGGVVASGVILFASGGAATPVVVAAWATVGASALYGGARAAGALIDRAQHEQTLSLADPEARAAWLSLAGSGLSIGGMGAMRLAAIAGNGTRLSATAARSAALLNVSANYADAAATVDTAHSLIANWSQLTPAQRAQMGLSIAFWGGMTGVSARVSGGSVTDAFSFRTQLNQAMITSGAAVQRVDHLQGDAIQIIRDPQSGRLSILHGPDTTPEAIRAYQAIASRMASDESLYSSFQRYMNGEPAPDLGNVSYFNPYSLRATPEIQTVSNPEPIRLNGADYDIVGVDAASGQLQLRLSSEIDLIVPRRALVGADAPNDGTPVTYEGRRYTIERIVSRGGPQGFTLRPEGAAPGETDRFVPFGQMGGIVFEANGGTAFSAAGVSRYLVDFRPADVTATSLSLNNGTQFQAFIRGAESGGPVTVEFQNGWLHVVQSGNPNLAVGSRVSLNEVAPSRVAIDLNAESSDHNTTVPVQVRLADILTDVNRAAPGAVRLGVNQTPGVLHRYAASITDQVNFIDGYRSHIAPEQMVIYNIGFEFSGGAAPLMDALVRFRERFPTTDIVVYGGSASTKFSDQRGTTQSMLETFARNNIEFRIMPGDAHEEIVTHGKGISIIGGNTGAPDSAMMTTAAAFLTRDKSDFSFRLNAEDTALYNQYIALATRPDQTGTAPQRASLAEQLAERGILITDPVARRPVVTQAINTLINEAQSNLLVQFREIREPNFAQRLIDAAYRGVDVTVQYEEIDPQPLALLTQADAALPNLRVEELLLRDASGAALHGPPGYPHYNAVIADGERAYIGSGYPWPSMIYPNSTFDASFENGLLLQGQPVTDILAQINAYQLDDLNSSAWRAGVGNLRGR